MKIESDSRMLARNLNEVVTDFDAVHGVRMVHPNSWASAKHKLFGYSTKQQLVNAINRKISK